MNFFIDVETTGFDYLSNCIIELACVYESDGEIISFCERSQHLSDHFWGKDAEAIHGISLDEINKYQSPSELCTRFLNFLENAHPYKRYRLCANMWYHGKNGFDWRMLMGLFLKQDLIFELRRYLNDNLVFSTLGLAKEKLQLPNYKLNTICQALDIELNHHEALSDALACMHIHRRLSHGQDYPKM